MTNSEIFSAILGSTPFVLATTLIVYRVYSAYFGGAYALPRFFYNIIFKIFFGIFGIYFNLSSLLSLILFVITAAITKLSTNLTGEAGIWIPLALMIFSTLTGFVVSVPLSVLLTYVLLKKPAGRAMQARLSIIEQLKNVTLIFLTVCMICSAVWSVWGLVSWAIKYTHSVTYAEIISTPEAKLRYPNAVLYSNVGSDEAKDLKYFGMESTFYGLIMTSNDSPKKIYSWYRDWLLAHGWNEDRNAIPGRTDTNPLVESYTRDGEGINAREVFYIEVNDKEGLRNDIGGPPPSATSVFEFRYMIKRK